LSHTKEKYVKDKSGSKKSEHPGDEIAGGPVSGTPDESAQPAPREEEAVKANIKHGHSKRKSYKVKREAASPSPPKKADDTEELTAGAEIAQPRKKKTNRKELLGLLQKKNEMLQEMEESLEQMEQAVKTKDDRIVRMAAEFENYKKRTRREWELLQKQANGELIREILGVLDDFDRALEAAGDSDDHFHSGVRMIFSGLLDILNREGLREIETQNQPFNPQYHEAMGEVESDVVAEGHIAHVVQKGYMLNDQLLRPARVVVAKKKKE
jgi:molecular chaperone GrpE